METQKVETKYFVEGKEAKLIASQCGTKIYKVENEESTAPLYYITNYDEVIAVFNTNSVIILENYIVK